jgi:hypothetical protein
METAHHFERFMRRTNEPAGDAQYRELKAHIGGSLHDLRGEGFSEYLDRDNWLHSQALAASLRASLSNGIVYPSVRWPEGQAAALFWPDLIQLPIIQARSLQFHWDGSRMTKYFEMGSTAWRTMPSS